MVLWFYVGFDCLHQLVLVLLKSVPERFRQFMQALYLLGHILGHLIPEFHYELVFIKTLFQLKIKFFYGVLNFLDGTV